jgi:hypothetical protein
LEITHYNRYFSAGHNKDQKYEEQEAKQIVELVLPNGGKDEKQLDKHGSKRQYSAHQNGEDWVHVPTRNKVALTRKLKFETYQTCFGI